MHQAIQAFKKYANKNLKILGVTVLTSLSNVSLKKIGHTKSINYLVAKQTKLAKAAGLDGIVCSGHEVKIVKKFLKKWKL